MNQNQESDHATNVQVNTNQEHPQQNIAQSDNEIQSTNELTEEKKVSNDQDQLNHETYHTTNNINEAPQNEDETTEQFHTKNEVEKSSVKTNELKQQAAEYFVVSDFDKAIDHYEQAMQYCPLEDVKMLSILNSNLATCYAKQGQYEEVIHYATDALKLDPIFKKALLNRAAAYEKTDKPEDALEDYKKLEEIDPSDKFVKNKRAQLSITVEQIQEKRKTEVLSGLKDLGNTILGKFGMSLDSFKLNQNDNGSYNIQYKQ